MGKFAGLHKVAGRMICGLWVTLAGTAQADGSASKGEAVVGAATCEIVNTASPPLLVEVTPDGAASVQRLDANKHLVVPAGNVVISQTGNWQKWWYGAHCPANGEITLKGGQTPPQTVTASGANATWFFIQYDGTRVLVRADPHSTVTIEGTPAKLDKTGFSERKLDPWARYLSADLTKPSGPIEIRVTGAGGENAAISFNLDFDPARTRMLKVVSSGGADWAAKAGKAGPHPGIYLHDCSPDCSWSPINGLAHVADAQIVARTFTTYNDVGSCGTYGGTSVKRVQVTTKVTIREATSGKRLATKDFVGGVPRECEDKEKVTTVAGNSYGQIVGPATTQAEIIAWLATQ